MTQTKRKVYTHAMEALELAELHTAIVQTWNVPPVPAKDLTWDEVVEALARKVAFLLRHDHDRLFSSLYLLDISEERSKRAWSGGSDEQTARNLAALILEREIEKMESRKRFRQEHSMDTTFTATAEEPEPGQLPPD